MIKKKVFLFIFMCMTSIVFAKAPETGLSFGKYLGMYYPNSSVIKELYVKMSPEQIDDSLFNLCTMLKEIPHRYFMNHRKDFDGRYLAIMLHELDSLLLFLESAKVDIAKKKIFYRDSSDVIAFSDGGVISLLDYFQENGLSAFYELYALSFDFLVVKFNSCMLSQYCDQVQRREADGALRKMKREVGHLKGSKFFEEAYQEYCKRYEAIFREWEKTLKDREAEMRGGKPSGGAGYAN
jgi:hypothetical protein